MLIHMIMTRESSNNSWIALHLRLITLLLAFDLLFAFSAVVSSSGSTSSISEHSSSSNNQQTSFFRTITTWLDQENIPWRRLSTGDTLFPKDIVVTNPIIEVTSHHSSTLYYLHIIKSPRSRNDCLSSTCTRDMTNYVQYLNRQSQIEQQQLELNERIEKEREADKQDRVERHKQQVQARKTEKNRKKRKQSAKARKAQRT